MAQPHGSAPSLTLGRQVGHLHPFDDPPPSLDVTRGRSATSIRSMTALVAKLRARLASGVSSGAGGGGGGGGELLLRAATVREQSTRSNA
jgi:hypothetical protein